MRSSSRAVEPCLVANVNGTHIFTFKIYYRFKDEITGEGLINPFLPYLINERKVKVLWKKKWYDLIIKKIDEDSQGKYITCTCEDLFITELSKNGYELEFSSELQNNSGTAAELAEKVLEGSGWQLSKDPIRIIQYHEEPVYEVITQKAFYAIKQSPDGDSIILIPSGVKCLLYQSSLDENNTKIQFLYSEDGYATEINNMLVTNGDCYTFDGTVHQAGNNASIYINNEDIPVFSFNISDSFSSQFRAKRLVNSQVTIFDDLLGRYVDVYNDGDVYGYETTEYSDPTLVINLLANTSDFKDTKGWVGKDLTWRVYPPFTGENEQTVVNYEAKSYLQITSGLTYNTAFVSNKKHLTPNSADIKNGLLGGIQAGEQYIFRYKAKSSLDGEYITNGITGNVYKYKIQDSSYIIDDEDPNPYFKIDAGPIINEDWVEYTLECERACPANKLEEIGFFINAGASYWIENIQFFKLSYGKITYDDNVEEQRIEPGMIALQSIANVVYRYYNADHDGVEDAKDLQFLYQGTTKSDNYIPVYNNYEKITSIEESKSNRFNILQSIAEKFECWVRFEINHNQETGQVLYDENGLPQKYVSLVEQIGNDTGISFEYGIDLQGIKRTIVSNTIATKAIIIPNENQFGKNGFCTIARSKLNYPRENFIINFDYYINQGLLDKNRVEADLYKTNGKNLGYYFYLNKYNTEYDELASAINIKKTELTKQQAELRVQSENYRASVQKLGNSQSDVMSLANVTEWPEAQAYAASHTNNRKVQSLMGSIAQLNNEINNLETSIPLLERSIETLKDYIEEKTARMDQLIELTSELHKAFFQKYSRYLQEGTWQDSNYVYDDDYYLDGLEVAYRSSRPQIQYDISLIRVSSLEDFNSKIFDIGDICYIQDREFFGYEDDKVTPYKQQVIISELTSYFDSPEKDIIKVQNYKTQFDDLFHRITTTTQSLQFAQGSYERAAGVVKPDGTLSFGMLQDTFDYNKDLVMNSANQAVTWDNTGITVSDESNSALKVRIIAGGIFVSDDGGETWKNAIRGDGISTDLLTAGRINTSEIFVYDGTHQSFRWDSQGINAYFSDETDTTNFGKFVRFDRFGLYGYQGDDDFTPATEDFIWDPENNVKFGLTWKGFFLRGATNDASLEISDDGDGIVFRLTSGTQVTKQGADIPVSLEISTEKDIVLKTGDIDRIQIGRYLQNGVITDYGIWVRDEQGHNIFNVSATGTDSIGGWNLTKDSFYHTDSGNGTLGLFSQGKNWTILGPTSTIADLSKIGNPQEGTGEPSAGDTHDYYIIAGNKFGVTIDGEVYAAGGRIGGWYINEKQLYGGNVIMNSDGNFTCVINNDTKWQLKNTGEIFAKDGEIAGWLFTSTGLYNKSSGTWINSGTPGSIYTIDTNSIRATGGLIGGCTVGAGSISGSNWSLTGTGGTIGGWTINANSISGSNISLNSSGSIDINGVSLTGRQGGGLTIGGNVYLVGNTLTAYAVNSTTGYTTFDGDVSSTLAYSQFNYLHWLQDNWGRTTPEQVRAEGRNQVINGATGGIAYDGDDYIWSWASYNGTTFASAHKYITTPATYGRVYFDYDYDEEGSWTGYCRARCTQCGETSWRRVR